MKDNTNDNKKTIIPTASAVLEDGTLVEMAFQPKQRRTLFAIYSAGRWTLQDAVDIGSDARLVPFSPNNNLVKNEVVLLPSEPTIYGSEEKLVADIQEFIHRHVDLDVSFEKVATYYVILTWLYDAFNELPYLRFRGDYGTGKTRALLVLGSLCYKGFFASGASTVSPIFHTLDAFRGTLIFDEADFRFSDEKAEIVKILNNGNVSGLPVLRTMMNNQREFNPRAFQVFGPKIVATRGSYDDKGLESRFITEEMGSRPLRSDIPINLPENLKDEARELRNKLPLYRFHRRMDVKLDESLVDPKLEPRLNQILLPLLSVVSDENLRTDLRSMAFDAQLSLVADRGLLVEAQVLEILAELMAGLDRPVVPVADIVAILIDRYGFEYERPITNRWIGSIIRKRLNIRTYKSHGVYVVPTGDRSKIELLCARYGVSTIGSPPPEVYGGHEDGVGATRYLGASDPF
ncbi:hypothetical protein G6321_00053530 [Bradyrhizobium barranii subsp. barranii]|uniref:DUF3631 domain-containing protein n=1 Tax=Bradyrhizobium barranii subsp. barranii TaxID=2823807 RepID=A0A7Z0QAF3_9BRAD|nr:hypothetical protein [Bradyrhizobium barranii]UGX94268.1 hypothetical protein G6321_00053530 [Bradyrhizobium barranii subsp. barranii]